MAFKYIISLGEDCFMRSLIDRFNLREKFHVRMPFDGSIHPYEEVCRLIETDFIDYGTGIQYVNNMFINSRGVCWNHEKNDNMESLIVQQQRRINLFRTTLQSGEKILFLIHNKNKDISFDFSLLERVLKEKYPTLDYHMFVFNNYHVNDYLGSLDNKTYLNIFWNPNNITDIDVDNLDYDEINNDFIKQMYNTPYGIEFSFYVLREICKVLNEDISKYSLDLSYDFTSNLS